MTECASAKVLAIESSGKMCSLALACGTQLLTEVNFEQSHVHDRLLATSIQSMLHDCGWQFADLDCLAISAGPGSFTGLRISASLAKGLCFELRPALVAVPTMHAVAHQAIPLAQFLNAQTITTLIPSHRNLLYSQKFDAQAKAISELALIEDEQVIQNYTSKAFYCGPAMPLKGLPPDAFRPMVNKLSAVAVAAVGLEMFLAGKTVNPAEFVPLYAQEFVPKVSSKTSTIHNPASGGSTQ